MCRDRPLPGAGRGRGHPHATVTPLGRIHFDRLSRACYGSAMTVVDGVFAMQDAGYALVPNVLEPRECEALAESLAAAVDQRGRASGNLRNLLRDVPAVAAVACADKLRRLLE